MLSSFGYFFLWISGRIFRWNIGGFSHRFVHDPVSRWACTVLSVPYTALQAGERPWLFTLLILVVVLSSTVFGLILITWGAKSSVGLAIEMAAYASVALSIVMLFVGIALSRRIPIHATWTPMGCNARIGICLMLGLVSTIFIGTHDLGLFILLPQGLRAMQTIVDQPFQESFSEAE